MVASTNYLLQCQHSESLTSKSVTLYSHDQLAEQEMGACRLEARLIALEREHQKIDAFKRELPLCMQLLHHAIEACKEQLALYRSSFQRQLQESVSCSFDDRDSVVQNKFRQHEPISTRRQSDSFYTSSNDVEQARVTQAFGEDGFLRMKVCHSRAGEKNQCTISLEEELPQYVQEQASGLPGKPAFSVKKKLGGAFVPYNRLIQPIPRPGAIDPAVLSLKCPELDITGPPNQLDSCKLDAYLWQKALRHDNSSAGVGLSICTKRVSSSQLPTREVVSKEQADSIILSGNHATRKARRSWSPELHRLFVDALQKLGGAQATPKQIRELMNVEGLTNDEVKSHLQKYRLHARRLGASATAMASTSSQSPGVVRAWVATEHGSDARRADPISHNCNSSISCDTSVTQDGIYCSSHTQGRTHSQTSSCCKKSTLLHSRSSWQGTDVGREESVGEAVRPENSGSKGRCMHESDEMEDHSFSGNQTGSQGEDEMGCEDNKNRSTF